MVACANEDAMVEVDPGKFAVFMNEHSETLAELLTEIIGTEAADKLEAELQGA